MFDKLRKAFSSAAKSIGQKEISARVLDDSLLDLQIALLESDVAQEVVDSLSNALKQELLGLKLEKGQIAEQVIQSRLKQAIAEIFARAGRIDLIEKIRTKKQAKSGPFSIVFLGINGTGKTTTVAKAANLLRKSGFSVVVAAGDTHRAGAIEQLTQHCERLSIKVIAQRYGADPSAVGRDALEYARKHYVDVVLIDTAGRMQTSKNLMDEMSKIVRVVKPDAKLFIGDSLAGNDTINQAREFYQYTNFDAAILTKVDADAKGGAAISIAHITSKPICYIGVGQGYDDIIPFSPDKFIETLFGSAPEVTVESLMSRPAFEAQQPPSLEAPPRVETKEAEHFAPVPIEVPVVEAQSSRQEHEYEASTQSYSSESSELQTEDQNSEPAHYQVEKSAPIEPQTRSAPQELKDSIETTTAREDVKPAKKSRFGFFGKKSKTEDKQKQKKDDEENQPAASDDLQSKIEKPKEKDEKKKRKEDKDSTGQKEEVVYLTDEDIEDLLK